MNEIIIDITQYDKTGGQHTQYYLDKNSFHNPLPTLQHLAANPTGFLESMESYCKIILTRNQNSKFIPYLQNENYHSKEFGRPESATHLLAFSFGESPDVNTELASIAQESLKVNSKLIATVQWEIADIISEKNPTIAEQVHRINLDKDQTYINTEQVIDKFITGVLGGAPGIPKVSLLVVAQAWHAPRCIRLCKEKGLDVIAGRFSEGFSANDPQEWVRNAFSWVLKEGTK